MSEKTFFIKSGSQIRLTNYLPIISDKLDVGTYSVKADQSGFYLEPIDNFVQTEKIYGDVDRKADRIIETFLQRPNSTGVLLEGEKGSGKTLLGKRISEKLFRSGISTFIVASAFGGDTFNTLVQSIKQPILFLFDEFEKVYNSEQQQALLPLLDGIYPSKKLFLVTVNDSYKVVEQMKNRPGRFFYRLSYSGLDLKFVEEYARDTLLNKDHLKSVLVFAASFNSLNFDILKALIEEMNRYNENAAEASLMLNAVPFDNSAQYRIVEFELGDAWKDRLLRLNKVNYGHRVNPFKESVYLTLKSLPKKKQKRGIPRIINNDDDELIWPDEVDDDDHVYFKPENIVKLEGTRFFYEADHGKMMIERVVKEEYDLNKFLL